MDSGALMNLPSPSGRGVGGEGRDCLWQLRVSFGDQNPVERRP
jgi:hypothetical protein